jgi:hypothetical protein
LLCRALLGVVYILDKKMCLKNIADSFGIVVDSLNPSHEVTSIALHEHNVLAPIVALAIASKALFKC